MTPKPTRPRTVLEDMAVTDGLRTFDLAVSDLLRLGISAAHLRSRIEISIAAAGEHEPKDPSDG